jgi:predicted transcriptional regulator
MGTSTTEVREESSCQNSLLSFTAEIVSAYVSNHNLSKEELPELMALVHKNLSILQKNSGSSLARPDPATTIEDSVKSDYIVCLEDGKKLKMLKRHLKTAYGMTPDQYRERWNLPADYPMVAPNYAKKRSKLARQIGLGTARKK